MAGVPLTKEMILNSAEDAILRFGVKKANVQDVARALDVSHPAIYRYFESKTQLWNAVADRWLEQIAIHRNEILISTLPADIKLHDWFLELYTSKHDSALNDPEMFATYSALVAESGDVLKAHLAALICDISKIISEGVSQGIFFIEDPDITASSMLLAFTHFHHPAMILKWKFNEDQKSFDGVWNLVLKGLTK